MQEKPTFFVTIWSYRISATPISEQVWHFPVSALGSWLLALPRQSQPDTEYSKNLVKRSPV